MAMQHHYPGAHFSPYHPLPQASVAAAFQPQNGMIANTSSIGGNGFVNNPLQNVHTNALLPRYSLSHPNAGYYFYWSLY